jgi:hypothetical protein
MRALRYLLMVIMLFCVIVFLQFTGDMHLFRTHQDVIWGSIIGLFACIGIAIAIKDK